MKKFYTTIFLSSMVAMATLLPSNFVHAAGAHDIARFTASRSTAAADNNSAITITVFVYDDAYLCANGQVRGSQYDCVNTGGGGEGTPYEEPSSGRNYAIALTGSGNTLSASTITTDSGGHATFSLKSSVAEAKTISLGTEPGTGAQGSISVTFTAAAATSAPTPKTTTKSSTPTPPPVVNPPAALTPESIQIDGKAVTADQKVTMQSDKSMELSGKTVLNGVVNLYVFSEPKKYTVTADKDGNWTYTVKGLEPGEHHIEAEVTDPATGKTSSRAQVLAFSVAKAAATTAVPTQINATKKANTLTIVGAVVGTVVLLAALTTFCLWKFKPAAFNTLLRRLHMKTDSLPPPSLL
jgi:hypothetical protein